MENLTVISHMYNEEFLLPYWLDHHKKIFKNGIIIDYLSTDNSIKIIEKICPHWKVIKTKNIINNKPNFDSILVDQEVMEIERSIETYKICLNTTEFLFFDSNFKFDKVCYGIKSYFSGCSKDLYFPTNCKDLLKNIDIISQDNARGFRYLHKNENLNYGPGRHEIYNNIERTIDDNIFILHIANYNLENQFILRKLQIQNNIPETDKIKKFGCHHILSDYNESINHCNNLRKTLININNHKIIKNIMDEVTTNSNFLINYCELVNDSSWGDDEIIIQNEINLLDKTDFNDSGYSIFKTNYDTDFLKKMIKNEIYLLTNKDINIEEYHNLITEEEHHKVLNNMPYKKNTSSELKQFCIHLENIVSNIIKEDVKIFNNDVWVRICRPNNVSITDFNPYHRDTYLDFYKNVVNIYLPISGSNEKSSLTMHPGSHLWNENYTMTTKNGAYFNTKNKKYSVDAIVASKIPIDMKRPNPKENEFLLFSPYLIHGGAFNENENSTRFSLEIRFIKNDISSIIQEIKYNEFFRKRTWR